MFRGAVKAVTGRAEDEPQPRRKSGETDKGFGMAAKALMRRAIRIPAGFYEAALDHVCDALEMMRFHGTDDLDDSALDDDYNTQQDTHFPQP